MIRFVDLFAGIGGMRLGFEQCMQERGVNHACVLSSEIDSHAQETYRMNFGECPQGDIYKIKKFPAFNFLTRKKLRLREIPLTAMEVTWLSYQKTSPEEMLAALKNLVRTVKKYNGTFVLLWHNSSFHTPEWRPRATICEALLNELGT